MDGLIAGTVILLFTFSVGTGLYVFWDHVKRFYSPVQVNTQNELGDNTKKKR